MGGHTNHFQSVVNPAARLQTIVPDLVLVGGSAAALHSQHRVSLDHDHVLADLADRYDTVVDADESSSGWATSVRASHPPMTLMGSLDGVRAGVRQLRRSRPIEVQEWTLDSGSIIRVPTLEEMLRIKAFLVLDRGATRDFLDVAALVDRMGLDRASSVLLGIDDYYAVRSNESGAVSTEIAVALANPTPRDVAVTEELHRYKGLAPRWHNWDDVVSVCQNVATAMAEHP